ncbi:sterol desaturase family protein [Flavobacterium lacus]|uniref:Beta-carotene 3-hydroxylase n=1 Tax=Flavobacterium lacus TaxID=1353778 RepID=A0A328WUJ5_9FLAO|nr:sterol desaturase family protein [Flavobacterium lacus]RAR48117.1 beta-carotene 3-hydroxylase [Flavobacterium lacus]
MEIVLYILTATATFFFMEFMAWFTHKYIMHGFMWYFHKDHHQHEPGFFEKNDVFFLIFAVPSWLCIMLGLMNGNYYITSIGFGIAIYGLSYFLMHDVFIHQRFKWFRNSNNFYLLALRKAHKIHHKHLGKENGEVFGMLIVPSKFFKEARRILANKK